MTETVDRLNAVIGADLSPLQAGIRAAEKMLNGFSVGRNLQSAGAAFTMLSAPIAAFGATGVKTAASFEDLMTQIKVFGGVAGKEFDTVRDFVLKMGADTVFSAQDAGGAMLDMLKAGMSLKEAMSGLPSVLQLAAVGNMSLAEASGVVTSGLAQYRFKAKDAARITDILAKAASASRADVRDLGQAMGNVGPIAAQFGLKYEDTAAILAVFANNGIMGAEAGTQLKSMLLNLSNPTKKTQKAYKQLGVSLYDTRGRMKDMNVFIKELDRALDSKTPQEQNELMKTLGGSYGILGLSALRAAGGIGEMRKAMAAAPGAGNIADASVGTFNRALEGLQGSIETLQITVLTPFIEDTLKPMVKGFTDITNKVIGWAKANPELALTITKIAAIVTTLGPGLFIVGTAIRAISSAFGALAGLLKPIILPLLVIGGLFHAYQTNWLGFRDTVNKIGDALRAMPAPLAAVTVGLALLAPIILKLALTSAVSALPGVISALAGAFSALLIPLVPILAPLALIGLLFKAYTDNTLGFRDAVDSLGRAFRELLRLLNLFPKDRSHIPGGKTLLERLIPGFTNPAFMDEGPEMPKNPKSGGSAGFGGAMSAARGGGLTKAFASGGPTGSRAGLGLFHPNEYVVPERGALVMRGNGGGYNGPSTVRVQLYTDRLIDEIDVSMAAAMAGAS